MTPSAIFIGVDVGSASLRTGAFDDHGRRLGFSERPIQQFRDGDRIEQSTTDIWKQLRAALQELTCNADIWPEQIRGIGFDATCSLVAIGRDDVPISVSPTGESERNIVMWMDHRAAAEAAEINATGDRALAFVCGEVSLEMELPKILWLRRHMAEQHTHVWRYFDLADYLVWRTTGADVASTCTLACKWNYLAHEKRFSDTLLAAVGLNDLYNWVPPRVLPVGARAGILTGEAAAHLGLKPGIPVATGMIDAHAGALALTGAAPSGALAMIAGTSVCHLAVAQNAISVPGVWGPYFGALLPEWWLNEGGQSAAGSLLDWTVQQSDVWPELRAEAQRSGRSPFAIVNTWVAELEQQETWPTARLHVVGDHHGNRSPRADAAAHGVACGLTLETGKPRLARQYLATLQAIAYGTREIIAAFQQAGHRIDRIVACGGATKNPLWMREFADATGRPIHQTTENDAVTLGSAILAAAASGAFSDLGSAAAAMVKPGRVITPRSPTLAFHNAKYAVYSDLHAEARTHREAMAPFLREHP